MDVSFIFVITGTKSRLPLSQRPDQLDQRLINKLIGWTRRAKILRMINESGMEMFGRLSNSKETDER